MIGFKNFQRRFVIRNDKRPAVCLVARRYNVQRPARNITQKERAGKRFVIAIFPNPFALHWHIPNVRLRNGAFRQLLQDVLAPFSISNRDRLAENGQIERIHFAPSTILSGSGVSREPE
jgi:hypothetical protein